MSNYSIKDLERITGVKAHTIRIWEKRYGLVKPMRTESNIRYYCDSELKHLLNVSLLIRHGFKISKLAKMDDAELGEKIREISLHNNGFDSQIETLILSMIDMDENKFEKTLTSIITKLGFENTIFNVLYPFFERIGVLWQSGSINPAQEHFISNLVKQKIYAALDGLPQVTNPKSKVFILFLPEWEMHEIGLLVNSYLLRNKGHKSIYLGQNLPIEDLEAVNKIHPANYLMTSFVAPLESSELQLYMEDLSRRFPTQKILISGLQLKDKDINLPSNVFKVSSAAELKEKYLT